MSYFNALGLEAEPFANTPNPEFFFHVPGRVEVLNLLEVSVRLKRGLSVVLGDVGTGKTTMCRQFIRQLGEEDMFVTFLLLDPYFASPLEFLRVFYGMLFRMPAPVDASEWQLKEDVKSELLHRAVDRNQIVTLILDEGQKIQDHCLELLRELLNFETNENKLLQIVIFGQSEFMDSLNRFENLVDRMDALHKLKPLNFLEMRDMIRYRLELASSGDRPPELFTTGAYWAIYHLTRGYPRKVVALCHKTMLALLMLGRSKATLAIVYKASGRNVPHVKWGAAGAVCAGCVAAAFLYVMPPSLPEKALDHGESVIQGASQESAQPGALSLQQPHQVKAAAHLERQAPALAKDVAPSLEQAAPEKPVVLPAAGSEVAQRDQNRQERVHKSQEPEEEWAPLQPLPDEVDTVAVADTVAAPSEQQSLGVMPLAKGELLSRAISKVYGMYRTAYLEKLLEVNPHIADPDRVPAGTEINYPVIVSAQVQDMGEGYWLRLDSFDTLQAAVAAMDAPPLKGHEVRLLPVADSAGMRFHVVAAKRFRKESQALEALAAFGQTVHDQSMIVRHWEPGAVLFTDQAVWGEALARR